MDQRPHTARRTRDGSHHVDRPAGRAWSTCRRSRSTARRAVAEAAVAVSPETMSLVIDGGGTKGDVLGVAELAGVMGGKRTSDLIPLCHPLALTDLVVAITPGSCRRRPAHPRRGRDDRPDRRRDGGDDRGVGRGADGLRHGQGRRARRRDPGRPARLQDRRQERHVGAPRRPAGRPGQVTAQASTGARRPMAGRIGAQAASGPDERRARGARRSSSRPATAPSAGVREDASGDARRGAPAGPRVRGRAASSPTTGRRSRPPSSTGRGRHALVVTTGGTGLTPRDVTPQATPAVIDYEVPGIAEAMRAAGRAKTPFADLSRGVVGVRRADARSSTCPAARRAPSSRSRPSSPVLDHALETLAGPFDHASRTGGG